MFNKIKIESNNIDYKGEWDKEDVEDEMESLLGIKIEYPFEWINFIFDHVFSDVDDAGINSILVDFAKTDAIEEMKIRIDGSWARITKER